METTTTVLNTSRKQNWNGRDNYWTYWMWWMMTSTKRTMKATEKALSTMKTMKPTCQKTPKITEYPSYPHTSGSMGSTVNDSHHRNRNRFVSFLHRLLHVFFGCVSWRVCGGCFFAPKYSMYLGILGFIFI